MSVEKGKVLAAIESKFKGKSISKTYKENLAARWAAKIESETEIDDYINERADDVIEASKEADKRATEAAQKAKQDAADLLNGKKPENQEPKVSDDAPEWVKAIMKQQETMAAELQSMKAEKAHQSIAEQFKKDERLKGIPEFILNKALPKSSDEFETAVTSLATEYAEFAIANKLQSFGMDIPANGNSKTESGKVDSDIVAFAKQKEATS